MSKVFPRGNLQAIVAKHMVTFKINTSSKPETKTKAVEAAQKELGDKTGLRARQIMNWMLRAEYKPGEIQKRLKAQVAARKPTKKAVKKTAKKAKKAAAPAETQVAA